MELEMNEEHITAMMNDAFTKENRDLRDRTLFLGSLLKLNGTHSYIAYKELSEYPVEIFREYIDYVLTMIIKIGNSYGKIFLLTILRNKFGFLS
jgi:hypothetical protein